MGAYRVRIPPDVAGIHGRTRMRPSTRSSTGWRRGALIAALALGMLAAGLGAALAAGGPGTVNVSPTDIAGPSGTVTVSGGGWDTSSSVTIAECRSGAPNDGCDQAGAKTVPPPDTAGNFTTEFPVSAHLSDATPCFNGSCFVEAWQDDPNSFGQNGPIYFRSESGVDLGIQDIAASPTTAPAGGTETFTTTVANDGANTATGVELFFAAYDANDSLIAPGSYGLPPGCGPVSSGTLAGKGVLCDLPDMAGVTPSAIVHSPTTASNPVSITVPVPTSGADIEGVSTVWSNEIENSPGDNSDYADVPISASEGNQPPDTTITTEQVQPGSAKFTFTGSDPDGDSLTFQCSLDGGAFTTCSSPKSYSALSTSGSHTFAVRAVDSHGAVDPTPATFAWNGSDNEAEGSFPPGGGTATTAGPKGATPSDSTTTTMTSTVGGDFSIDETPYNAPGTLDCGSFTDCIGQDIQITFTQTQTQAALLRTSTAPPPYRFKFAFTFDKSVLAGHPFATLTMIHDGVALPTCTRTLQQQRQQCVADRRHVGNGDERLIVLSNQNGSWRGH